MTDDSDRGDAPVGGTTASPESHKSSAQTDGVSSRERPASASRTVFAATIVAIAFIFVAIMLPPTSLYVLETETNRIKYTAAEGDESAGFIVSASGIQTDSNLIFPDAATRMAMLSGAASTQQCTTVTVIPAAGSSVTFSVISEQTTLAIRNAPGAPAAKLLIRGESLAIDGKVEIALSFVCDQGGFTHGTTIAIRGADIQLGARIDDLGLDLNNERRDPGKDLRVQARSADGFVSGTLQAYSKSIFCRDFGVVSNDGDCSLYAARNEPMPIPPGASLAPERFRSSDRTWVEDGWAFVRSRVFGDNIHENEPAIFLGSAQFSPTSLAVNVSADANLVRLFYPTIDGMSIRTPAFKITWLEQVMVEPVLGLALAILLGGGSPVIRRYFGNSYAVIRHSKAIRRVKQMSRAVVSGCAALGRRLGLRKANPPTETHDK